MSDSIKKITQSILKSYEDLPEMTHLGDAQLPSPSTIREVLDKYHGLLFPGYACSSNIDDDGLSFCVETFSRDIHQSLVPEIAKALANQDKSADATSIQAKSEALTLELLAAVPQFRELLKKDIQAIYEGDPAAISEEDVILSYPGFYAVMVYRIAHFLHKKGLKLIPRILTEIAHSKTGVDIHPAATIGEYFCIDHGTGVVVGETAIIGDHVKLYQGVTIGALSVSRKNPNEKRHPTLGDHVTVYARTTILGGQTEIGNHSIIGGNVWLTNSVPEHSKIYISSDQKQIQGTRNPS